MMYKDKQNFRLYNHIPYIFERFCMFMNNSLCVIEQLYLSLQKNKNLKTIIIIMIRQQRKKIFATCLACALLTTVNAQAQFLPVPAQEAKPGVRWWWMGSAVDKENLEWNLEQYAKVGIGAVEITPLYGVQGNDKNDIP